MDETKKRKLGEANNLQLNPFQESHFHEQQTSVEELRSLLQPVSKTHLVDLLASLGSQSSSITEEIRSLARADPGLRKLFVRGLAWNTTSETLCAAFEVHGEIEEGAVIVDKVTGKSRGYGFITYKDLESAQNALKAPSKMIDGSMAACNLASEGLSNVSVTSDQSQRKVYIGGLSPDTTSEILVHFFGRHGVIEEGSVAYDKDTNKSRGFGFITYKTVEGAKKALDDTPKILGGRNIIVKLADNYKGKVSQTQVPPAVITAPLAAGYPPQRAHSGSGLSSGYNYPQSMAPYPAAAFSSPHTAGTPFSAQTQIPYPQYTVRNESPTVPYAGIYPYYTPR